VSPEEWLAAEFERCKGWIADALDACPIRTHELEHVWDSLQSGHAQLWPKPKSAVVSSISTHPTGLKTICAWLGGGDLSEIRQTVTFLEGYAREQGCKYINIQGRPGWSRALPGFRAASTMIYKDLQV
jgi:hypothetical protein